MNNNDNKNIFLKFYKEIICLDTRFSFLWKSLIIIIYGTITTKTWKSYKNINFSTDGHVQQIYFNIMF